MVLGGLLVCVTDSKHRPLIERPSQNLHTERKARVKAARQRQSRKSRKVSRDREADVGGRNVFLHTVDPHLAAAKHTGGLRQRRSEERVIPGEHVAKTSTDKLAGALRVQVCGGSDKLSGLEKSSRTTPVKLW